MQFRIQTQTLGTIQMNNVKTAIKGDELTITVNVSKASIGSARPSASGKTKVVASTGGNQGITLPDGTVVYLGLNAYVK